MADWAVDLIEAIAGEGRCSRAEAAAIAQRADRLGVDVFEVMAAQLAIAPAILYERAAFALGIRYCSDPRDSLIALGRDARLDALSGTRSARGLIDGRQVLFMAPDFGQLLKIADYINENPQRAASLLITAPAALHAALAAANAELLIDEARHKLARQFPRGAAHLELSLGRRLTLAAMLVMVAGLSLSTPLAPQALLALMTLFLAAPSVFRLWAAYTHKRNRMPDALLLSPEALPLYSVLIPLRNEAHMVPQIAAAMRRLDYPPEKLDIVFVIEDASPRTVAAARAELWDSRFRLITVPNCRPLTKPKALNFALPFARGEHVVVFDAEDIPDRGQLRRAASILAAHPRIDCLQASLLIANADANWITRLFAAEYAGHFDVVLPAISRAGFPMPLGGTSNHFRTETLRRAGAWDAFNVTEDADLGIRFARLGLRCASFVAITAEEAPDTARGWLHQRSRWMKGWMQTLLVHAWHPREMIAQIGLRNYCAFVIFVGSMIVSVGLHAPFLLLTLYWLASDLYNTGAVDPFTIASLLSLALGYAGAVAVGRLGLQKTGRSDLTVWLTLLPLYWMMAWAAVLRAIVELIRSPYHWSKTSHRGALAPHRQKISWRRRAKPRTQTEGVLS